jgi:hypothetical protein
MAKADKMDVDYSVGMAESHCGRVFKDDKGYCKFFLKKAGYSPIGSGECEKVAGSISPVYWCKLWEKAD